jgi:hypothetical protein
VKGRPKGSGSIAKLLLKFNYNSGGWTKMYADAIENGKMRLGTRDDDI